MPTYNRSNLVIQCFEEWVCPQEYKEWELIIVNDGSSDFHSDVLKDYFSREKSYHHIKLIRLDKCSNSVSIPRAIGISHSMGEFISHWDDDVLHYPNKLKELVNLLVQNPNYLLSYGQRDTLKGYWSLENKLVPQWETSQKVDIPHWNPSERWGVDGGQYLYRSCVYEAMDLVFCRRGCDWETAKKIWELFPKFICSDKEVCGYVWHDSNRSLNKETVSREIYPKEFLNYFNQDFISRKNINIPNII